MNSSEAVPFLPPAGGNNDVLFPIRLVTAGRGKSCGNELMFPSDLAGIALVGTQHAIESSTHKHEPASSADVSAVGTAAGLRNTLGLKVGEFAVEHAPGKIAFVAVDGRSCSPKVR